MKTKDSLEKFIVENRQSFDTMEPDPELWKKMMPHIKVKRSANRLIALRYAAAVAVIAVAAGLIYRLFLHNPVQQPSQTSNIVIPELVEAENYYTAQINSRKAELLLYTKQNPEILADIQRDFCQLDSIYLQLKRDLGQNVANEQVISAMIQNYRYKLEILEGILKEIKPSNSFSKNENDNKTTSI